MFEKCTENNSPFQAWANCCQVPGILIKAHPRWSKLFRLYVYCVSVMRSSTAARPNCRSTDIFDVESRDTMVNIVTR